MPKRPSDLGAVEPCELKYRCATASRTVCIACSPPRLLDDAEFDAYVIHRVIRVHLLDDMGMFLAGGGYLRDDVISPCP